MPSQHAGLLHFCTTFLFSLLRLVLSLANCFFICYSFNFVCLFLSYSLLFILPLSGLNVSPLLIVYFFSPDLPTLVLVTSPRDFNLLPRV